MKHLRVLVVDDADDVGMAPFSYGDEPWPPEPAALNPFDEADMDNGLNGVVDCGLW